MSDTAQKTDGGGAVEPPLISINSKGNYFYFTCVKELAKHAISQ